MLAHAGRLSRMPSLVTLEGCMKLSAMVVQGLWECRSPLMQLPHITDENLKYFSSKRYQVIILCVNQTEKLDGFFNSLCRNRSVRWNS
jgi:hypothetical protein